MHAALKAHWPTTRVQRCLVHLQRNIGKYVTTRSKTVAGKALWGLALKLTRVKTADDAAAWVKLLIEWESAFLPLTKERTYRRSAAEVPSWVRSSQQWWYTHQRLRSDYQVLSRVIDREHLFTFLGQGLHHLNAPSTTNGIEGSTNSSMRLLLLHHRGMSEEHQRRLVECWLYAHSENPDAARVLAQHKPKPAQEARPASTGPDPGPALYGNELTAEEGLWLRSGTAGNA